MIPHLTFIHPPTVLDFRKNPVLYGPISDGVPSTSVFEMYPIGFTIMTDYLGRFGYSTRIINLGMKMMVDPSLDLENFLKNLKARVIGIDLHWMPHVHSTLECARIIKKYHPDIPIVLGGLSSTYFHQDLIKYPQIDYVIRGDCAEEPILKLLEVINKGGSLHDVPNLTWKDAQGEAVVNPFTYSPKDLDYININYNLMIQDSLKHQDVCGYMPYHEWISYPVVAVLTCKGCGFSCVSCGGSSFSGKINCFRKYPIFRSNKMVVNDILRMQGFLNSPIFLLGDLTQKGEANAFEFFELLRPAKLKNELIIEFFRPPSRELLKAALESVPNLSIEISPETHDDEIRNRIGKPFLNSELERMIADAHELGCKRIDLFFMVGLSYQTTESVRDTVSYLEHLLKRFGKNKLIFPYIDPLAPFIDPGSRIHENPDEFGYTLLATKVEEYRQVMQTPSWKYMLNYETKWMNRDQIVDATYEASLGFNRLKKEYGIISAKDADKIDARIRREIKLSAEIDRIWAKAGGVYRPEDYQGLGMEWKEMLYNKTTCTNDELERTVWLFRFLPMPRILRHFMLDIFELPFKIKSFVCGLFKCRCTKQSGDAKFSPQIETE